MDNSWWNERYWSIFNNDDYNNLVSLGLYSPDDWMTNFKRTMYLKGIPNWEEFRGYNDTLPDTDLIKLTIADVYCSSIPPTIIKYNSSLRELYVYNLQITHIPSYLLELENLRVLNIQRCPVVEIPDWIEDMINLEVLNVSRCRVSKASQKIGNLTRLKELILCRNELKTIDDNIFQLDLQRLDLSHNPMLHVIWKSDFKKANKMLMECVKI
ncbi:MAG: leucine-rich repeat domain-containing protein [Flavobacteriaceae bacterium]|nr:leucine-rich repeat domain-containing protein [Flavobacteriaceae bacterium]